MHPVDADVVDLGRFLYWNAELDPVGMPEQRPGCASTQTETDA